MLGARNEVVIMAADGTEHRALYNNRALADVESLTGKSVLAIIQGFVSAKSGIKDIACLLQAGMEAHRRESGNKKEKINADDAYRVMDEVGMNAVADAIMEGVLAVLNYGTKKPAADAAQDDGGTPNV